MDALLHRIEALPGEGRYALTFRRQDGGEQTAVAQVAEQAVSAAESALPLGWALDSDAFGAVTRAVLALHESRRRSEPGGVLRDVDGGWDVGLGNVVLGGNGVPTCTAHGAMADAGDAWVCAECDARALLD